MRQQRQTEPIYGRRNGTAEAEHTEYQEVATVNGNGSINGVGRVSREKTTKVSVSGSKLSTTTRTTVTTTTQQQHQSNNSNGFDVKTMQKEAVLSYVKSKQQQQQHHQKSTSSLNNGSRSSSTTSIPQPNRRSEAEKAASADVHIAQLRTQIESRLRIGLPEDLASALQDGVILCHMANHVRPRAVPSIHVPSPAVVSELY